MTDEQLERIEGLASAATPGAWVTTQCGRGISHPRGLFAAEPGATSGWWNDVATLPLQHIDDAAYIAAVSPDVVLALIAALREARALAAAGEVDAATLRALADDYERARDEITALAPDAARWRSLWACQRIRVVGGADLGTPDALLGLDFHRVHPDRDDAESRRTLLAFVDAPQPKRDPVAALEKLRAIWDGAPPVDVAAELREIRDAGLLPVCVDCGSTSRLVDEDGCCSCGGEVIGVEGVRAREVIAEIRAERDEALAEIAAYQGRPEGAISEGWAYEHGQWVRALGAAVSGAQVSSQINGEWSWDIWHESGAHVADRSPSPRSAMRAAEAVAQARGWLP